MSEPDIKKDKFNIGKLTIKEPYSKTRFLSKQTRGILDLFRPYTLLAPIIVSMAIMVASLVNTLKNDPSFADRVRYDWWITVGQASFTIAIINAASNSLNQATDVDADKISKAYRPIPRGIVTVDTAQSLAYILYLFALLRAVTINVWFGTFVFLIMIFTVSYSLPPRIKKYIFLNQLWIAIPRGLFGILASWSVFGDPFTATPLTIGLIATVFMFGGIATKDIVDAEADKQTGTKTMINTYGIKKTALLCFPFMFFPFAFIPIFISQDLLLYYLWPLTILVLMSLLLLYLMLKATESKSLENVHAWSLMYVQYIIFALGFSLLTIFSDELGFLNMI